MMENCSGMESEGVENGNGILGNMMNLRWFLMTTGMAYRQGFDFGMVWHGESGNGKVQGDMMLR
jgi:hypothetical protein